MRHHKKRISQKRIKRTRRLNRRRAIKTRRHISRGGFHFSANNETDNIYELLKDPMFKYVVPSYPNPPEWYIPYIEPPRHVRPAADMDSPMQQFKKKVLLVYPNFFTKESAQNTFTDIEVRNAFNRLIEFLKSHEQNMNTPTAGFGRFLKNYGRIARHDNEKLEKIKIQLSNLKYLRDDNSIKGLKRDEERLFWRKMNDIIAVFTMELNKMNAPKTFDLLPENYNRTVSLQPLRPQRVEITEANLQALPSKVFSGPRSVSTASLTGSENSGDANSAYDEIPDAEVFEK